MILLLNLADCSVQLDRRLNRRIFIRSEKKSKSDITTVFSPLAPNRAHVSSRLDWSFSYELQRAIISSKKGERQQRERTPAHKEIETRVTSKLLNADYKEKGWKSFFGGAQLVFQIKTVLRALICLCCALRMRAQSWPYSKAFFFSARMPVGARGCKQAIALTFFAVCRANVSPLAYVVVVIKT